MGNTPEIRIFQSIVIQAVKDYMTVPEEKPEIRHWVETKEGTFKYCAVAMKVKVSELQKMMLSKLDEIDRSGETKFKWRFLI
jgi:hypothetical protein